MKKIIFLSFVSFMFFSSCSHGYYQKETITQTTGIDFSNGRWLLGNIDVDAHFKDELTAVVVKDFSKRLEDRFASSANDRSLLIATHVPLKPSKSYILDLKKGTNYDYFINIKCTSDKSRSMHSIAGKHVDRFTVDKYYYADENVVGIVQLEVYDLNRGLIIYSQRVRCYPSNKVTRKVGEKLIIGCYQNIMEDIDKKSQYKLPIART